MKSFSTYQDLFDSEIEKELNDWKSVSPLDPMKMVINGIAGSLGVIEERQGRLAKQILGLSPALIGLEPKRAVGPQVLLEMKAKGDGPERVWIEPGTLLDFTGKSGAVNSSGRKKCVRLEGNHYYEPIALETYRVIPKSTSEDLELCLDLNVLGKARSIFGYWIKETADNPHQARSDFGQNQVKVQVEFKQGERVYQPRSVTISDQTEGLQQSGLIKIEINDPELNDFPLGPIQVRFRWKNTSNIQSFGRWVHQAVIAECLEIQEWCEVGHIKRDFWDSIQLPSNLLEVPNHCELQLGNGSLLSYERVQTELLGSLSQPDSGLDQRFFYHPVDHSIVFPTSHRIDQASTMGIPVLFKNVLFSPESNFDWNDSRLEVFRSNATPIEFQFVQMISNSLKRETNESLMARYYQQLRGTAISVENRILDLPDLCNRLQKTDPRIRSLEIDYQADKNELFVYVSTTDRASISSQTDDALSIPFELRQKLMQVLSETLPFSVDWRILSFRKKALRALIQFDSEKLGASSLKQVKESAIQFLQTRLNPSEPVQSSIRLGWLDLLNRFTDDGSNSQWDRVQGTLIDDFDGRYLDSVILNPGLVFKIDLKAQLRGGHHASA